MHVGIFVLAMAIYLFAIYRLTKSFYAVLFGWLGLYAFRELSTFIGTTIASETSTFLVLSIWFLTVTYYLEKPARIWGYLLAFLTGMALASKFTTAFYLPILVGVVLVQKTKFMSTKILTIITLLTCYFISFFVITWPIRDQYSAMAGWIIRLATHPNIHGNGSTTLFSLEKYTASITTLLSLEKWAIVLVSIFAIAMVIYVFKNKKEVNLSILMIFAFSLLGNLVFAKFPLAHYQLPNYFALIFSSSYLFTRTSNGLKIAILVLLISILPSNIRWFYADIGKEITLISNFEKHLQNNPAQQATVWEWSRASDYTLLHSRDWIGHIYAEKLKALKPTLYGLDYADMSKVIAADGARVALDDICWDKLYVQEASYPILIKKNPKLGLLQTKSLANTTNKMIEITSSSCRPQ
jgi:4-amino-4-deoxy-L-arabinose transferase-like glycosyltransferase